MKLIQAWLYRLSNDGGQLVSVQRDKAELLSQIESLEEDSKLYVHIGFEPESRDKVWAILKQSSGRFFGSNASRLILEREIDFDPVDCAGHQSDELPRFQSTDSTTKETLDQKPLKDSRLHSFLCDDDWISACAESDGSLADIIAEWSIDSDEKYWNLEAKIEFSARRKLGQFRQRFFFHEALLNSPRRLLRICPPWLLDRDISTIPFSVRIRNVIKNNDITDLKELAQITDSQLLNMPNFGRRSLRHVCETIVEAVNEGPFGDDSHHTKVKGVGLASHVTKSLGEIPERDADILSRRMGLYSQPHTLEQLGGIYGVSRERIRQIESKAIRRLVSKEYWDDVLMECVSEQYEHQKDPLYLHYLAASEEWLKEFENNLSALKYLIEHFCCNRFFVVKFEDMEIVTELSPKELDAKLSIVSTYARLAVEERWAVDRFVEDVIALFPPFEDKFGDMIAQNYLEKLTVSENSFGRKEIVSDSRGANGPILQILERSPTPLHYSDVHKQMSEEGHTYDIRRVHGALGDIGYVFGRGEYGLEKHLKISHIDRVAIVDAILQHVSSSQSRQWHTSELYNVLQDEGLAGADLDPYKVNVILQTSETTLSYLGRNVWKLGEGKTLTAADRLDVRQAIIAIIEKAGHPLPGNEIIERVQEIRGLSGMIQIHPKEPVVRVAPGMWGLLGRDISLSSSNRIALMNELYRKLSEVGHCTSVTALEEVEEWSAIRIAYDIDSESIYGLSQLDSRFRTAHGELIGLSEWESIRGLTVAQAIRNVLQSNASGLSLPEVTKEVASLFPYEIEQRNISQRLATLGDFDSDAQRWFPLRLDLD